MPSSEPRAPKYIIKVPILIYEGNQHKDASMGFHEDFISFPRCTDFAVMSYDNVHTSGLFAVSDLLWTVCWFLHKILFF